MINSLSPAEIIEAFKNAMREYGITPPDYINADGNLHRFHIEGQKANTSNGAYKLNLDGKPSGYFQDFVNDIKEKWLFHKSMPPLTPEEKKAYAIEKANREQERLSEHEKAAKKAQYIWQNSQPAPDDFPYLTRKHIKPYSIRYRIYEKDGNPSLIIPMFDKDNAITGLQFIFENGSKRFLKGSQKGFFILNGNNDYILICEGFATGASLFEATGYSMVIAFDAGNLENTAKTIREKYPTNNIILCADNDANHLGKTKAKAACLAVNAKYIIPPINGMDFNDYVNSDMAEDIKAMISHAQPVYADNTPPTIENADWYTALLNHVHEFNQTHAQVMIGGKYRIMRIMSPNPNNNFKQSYEFVFPSSLVGLYQNTRIKTGERVVKGDLKESFADYITAWTKHKNSRVYRKGVVFDPSNRTEPDYFNTWQGFGVQAMQGDCELIHEHIFEIICNGDAELYNYVIQWIAYTFQNPDKPAGSALVLRGEKGTGKSTLGHFLCRLWGNHSLYISNAKHLVHNFNGHLADVCFVFADEAFYSGDKQHESVFKSMITEEFITIERKGIDAANQRSYLKLFMATNNEWAVPATRDERRYCVCDISNTKRGNRDYFNRLHEHCRDETVQAAFLHQMLNMDIKGFHTGDIPDTEGLKEQRMHSLKPSGKWLLDSLDNGYFETPKGEVEWQEALPAKILYDSYLHWCNRMKISEHHRESQMKLGNYLREIGFEKKHTKTGDERIIGSLKDAIIKFERYEKIIVTKK